MTENKQILVIGGGPAGIQAALAASGTGNRVMLVSDSPLGGRAAWQTLLPSKMWLNTRITSPDEFDGMRRRFENVAGAWQRQIEVSLEQEGVDVRLGTASFLSPHEIQILPPEGGYPDQISADAVIIASGAVPFVPPGLKPDGERIFSPHTIWKLDRIPRDMIVVGSGGPATEYVDAFSRMGVAITWVTGPVSVLSAYPPEAGQIISKVMEKRGVRIVSGIVARQIEHDGSGVRLQTGSGDAFKAEMAFVAIGLRPDLERLNLPAAGIKPGSTGGVATDPYGRTSVEHIYLAGDAANPFSANISLAQGRLAGRHAAGLDVEPLNMETAVMAIYTNPQVAMIGHMSDRNQPLAKVRAPFRSCLRSHLIEVDAGEDTDGFLEVTYLAAAPRKITGALAICPEAAEILTPLAVAIKAGMTIDELSHVYTAHPTYSELAVLTARMAR